jgi:hypothetical protein
VQLPGQLFCQCTLSTGRPAINGDYYFFLLFHFTTNVQKNMPAANSKIATAIFYPMSWQGSALLGKEPPQTEKLRRPFFILSNVSSRLRLAGAAANIKVKEKAILTDGFFPFLYNEQMFPMLLTSPSPSPSG